MTNELSLLTQEEFGEVELELYRNNENEIFMTVSQLAQAERWIEEQKLKLT